MCLSNFLQTNKQTHIDDPTSNRIHGRQNSTNFLSIINVGCVMMNFFFLKTKKNDCLMNMNIVRDSVKILINNIVSGSLVVVVVIVCCMPLLLLLLLLNNHCQTNHSSVNYYFSEAISRYQPTH